MRSVNLVLLDAEKVTLVSCNSLITQHNLFANLHVHTFRAQISINKRY